MYKLKRISMVAALLGAAVLVWQVGGIAQQRLDFQFLDAVAHSKGLPVGALEVGDRVTLSYPVTGVTLDVAKVVDRGTGEAYLVGLDAQGRAVDPAAAEAAEARAREQKYGKLDPSLHGQMVRAEAAGGRGDNEIPVAIWVKAADPPFGRPQVSDEELPGAYSAYLAAVQQYMAGKTQGVLNELRGAGAASRAPKYGPAVFAKLNPGQLRRLSKHPDVAAIYGQADFTTFSDDAATTLRSHRVWAGANLGAGASSRPAVHEPGGVADGNIYLNNATHPVLFWCSDPNAMCTVGKNTGSGGGHATMVAGMISSTHALYRGNAPNAQVILSANSQDFSNTNLVEAAEWAIGNSAGVTNMSWGTTCGAGAQEFMGRYIDWAVKNLWHTFTIAAGNQIGGCPTDRFVSSPGIAWSVITVGSQYDLNGGFWSGDGMSGFSQYVDPPSGQQKPEVVAVGENVRTTDHLGGDHLTPAGVSGTSFSSPSVAGVVTQMLNRKPGQRIWPEANKAAILASAWHDIEPGTTRDGVGSVVATVADDTYKNTRFANDSAAGFPLTPANFVSSCAPVGGANCRRFDNKFTATAGNQVRVAIAWDSWSTGGAGPDVLGADIDLYVIAPNNVTVVGSSISVPNAWEMVQFVAPATGTYDIVVKLFSSAGGWPGTFLGAAWSFNNATTMPNFCAGETLRTVSVSGTQTAAVNTANGGTYFDGYTGWVFDQSGREGLIKLTLTTMKDITLSDTNAGLDLHLVQLTGAGCSADPVTYTALGHTINGPIFFDNRPAGTYYIIVDGFNGAVGSTTVTITAAGP